MHVNRQLIENFQAPIYGRTPRNDDSYKSTYRYCHDRLDSILNLYNSSSNDQQTLRLIRDDMDNLLRRYHGYCIKEKIGAHYLEVAPAVDQDFEHLIPAARIRDLMISGIITIDQALNCPTVTLSRNKHHLLKKAGWASNTPDIWYPFRRYTNVFQAKFITHDGKIIEPMTWSLEDHYKHFQYV